jgi:glycosyltransferase involved in cell wall biosynthesis
MKVMLAHSRYRSTSPSGENQAVDREAGALVALGHDVIRFERQSDAIEQWPAVKKAALPARVVWSRESYRDLRRALAASRPDVVHVHNTFPLLSPAVLYACRDAHVPVVVTLHNYRLLCAGGTFFRDGAVCHDCVDGSAIRAVVHGCYRESRLATAPIVVANGAHRQAWKTMVSAYIFVSASQRDLMSSLNLPPERVFVRHNLIPRRAAAQPVPRDDSVLYAGRLDEVKGVRLLMSGWDRYLARSGHRRLRLVIAGSGTLGQEVAAWASGRPSVEMLGHVDMLRCRDLMARARAVVLPSAYEEPFGLVAVEALAAGTPPIAAGHGALAELITPGVDGVLFTPGDPGALGLAIADVQNDPERYESYGAQASEAYQKRFDADRNIEHLAEIYRFAISNPA